MSYKVRVHPGRCKSCELCLPACPKKIMVISSQRNPQGFQVAVCSDPSLCTGCMACAVVCPDTAIEIFKEESKS